MSTRGAYGFRLNGRDLIAYNHSDSYPAGLGNDILAQAHQLTAAGLEHLKGQVARLKQINQNAKPTPEDVKALERWTDLSVSNQSKEDWYCLTRGMQGDLNACLESGYFPADYSGFLRDSLFCEYAYIINIDDGTLEVYAGFNKDPHAPGRYAKLRDKKSDYYGVKLLKAYPLADLPKDLSAVEEEPQEA